MSYLLTKLRGLTASVAAHRPTMTMLLMYIFGGFLLWAAVFQIDQTVRAQGQIIASSRTQVIQAADGGVISELLVQEGQSVVAGQPLAVLEQERSKAAFDESLAKEMALSAALVRAQAEALEKSPVFGKQFQDFPEFVKVQRALYDQKKRSLREEIDSITDSLDMAREELKMNESLLDSGDISRLDVMRSKRQVTELQGKLNATRNKYLQDARQEAAKLSEDLSASQYKREGTQNVLDHTTLTAPVAGVVKYMKVTTIGGVLRSGDELMQISPSDAEMVVEVKVNPVDIGQLKIGLPATVKLDAFDYSIFGSLKGTLTYVSSDTLSDQAANGQTTNFYRAQIHLTPAHQQANRKLDGVALKSGMTVSTDIRTDSRSVLSYLLKPIFKAFSGAMNER